MAETGDKIVMTVKEKYRHSSGETFYIMEGNKRWVFTDDDLADFERLPFSPEDLTLGSIVDNPDPGIIQRYLEYAKETGRDFHMTITAEGETIIDVTVPTKTVTESKFYSIPDKEDDPDKDDPDDCCDTCKFSGVPEKGYPCVECKHGHVSKYQNAESGKEEASCQTCVYKDDDRFCKSCKRSYLDGYERKV